LPEAPPSPVRLTLPSTLPTIEQLESTALDFAHHAGFDPDTASNIAMVVREAAVNAVVHGNRFAALLQVHATFLLAPEALTISIADSGPGLDPAGIPDPLAPENLLRTSGRGVFLMRSYMDEVHFRQLDPGTEVTLVKRRTRPAANAPKPNPARPERI
jgi:serine/threonine-protein kinase RsbW